MIVSFSKLRKLRNRLKSKKIVLAGGIFDIYHDGHLKAFKEFKSKGDILVIAISSDTRVRQRKGWRRPIFSAPECLRLVDAIRYVDYCLIAPRPIKQKSVPTMRIMERLRPDIFISPDKRWLNFRNGIEKLGIKMKIVPHKKINSTGRIIGRILKRYCVKTCQHSSLHRGDSVRHVLVKR